MKTQSTLLAVTLLLGAVAPLAHSVAAVSVDFFYDDLQPYGDWREVGDYGYCWQPRGVAADWRPYGDGHWLYTDAGWTWDSEEPYSWAVYHYGRWARVDEVGWVWVPGSEWGPAWVSWRSSAEYIGWAPLPPEAQFSASVGLGVRVDADFDIGPENYAFVEVRNFGAPRLQDVFVAPQQNITIINQTTNITKVTYVNNAVFNGGPQYETISRQVAQPIRQLKLDRRPDLGGDPHSVQAAQLKSKVEGGSFHVVAPTFDLKGGTAPKKIAAKVDKAQVDHGWKNAGSAADVAKVRAKIKSEPANPGAAETAPASPGRPVTPEPPAKPGKAAPEVKPMKPEAGKEQPLPPANKEPLPPGKPKKGEKKGKEVPPATPEPQPQVPEKKAKPENAETPHNPMPPEGESPREKLPGKGEAKPRPEPPAERPNPSESRPEAKRPEPRPQVAPGGQPQQPEPPKGKGKEKEKDEKKDAKPE